MSGSFPERDNDLKAYGSKATIWTVGDNQLPENAKGVIFAGNGTIAYKNSETGSEKTGFPVLNGVPLGFIPYKITAMTGPTICFIIH